MFRKFIRKHLLELEAEVKAKGFFLWLRIFQIFKEKFRLDKIIFKERRSH